MKEETSHHFDIYYCLEAGLKTHSTQEGKLMVTAVGEDIE